MKKIVCCISPFETKQTVYILEDGKTKKEFKISLYELPSKIIKLANTFSVNDIDLAGTKSFAEGIKNHIQETEITQYSKNKLNINII
jgi:hypothetical protein